MNRRPERSEVCVTGVLQDSRRIAIKQLQDNPQHSIHHPIDPNSQILAEFQSVLPKSPGLGQGRAGGSLSLLVSLVFEVELFGGGREKGEVISCKWWWGKSV